MSWGSGWTRPGSPFFVSSLPRREASPPPFYTISWACGYDFLTIHFRHSWQRRRLGVRRTYTVTRQSSQDQCEPPLGAIGVDRLPQDGRIGVHERLILLSRDMGSQVARGQPLVRFEAQVMAQPALALGIAKGGLGQFLQLPGLVLGEAGGLGWLRSPPSIVSGWLR
jgi:hypothetical protein